MPYTIPNMTNGTTGLEDLLISTSSQIPSLFGMILFFIFIVIAGAGYYSQERRNGRGNLPMWLAISGMITTVGGFFLFLIRGLVSLQTLMISLSITIVCIMWFLLTPDEA